MRRRPLRHQGAPGGIEPVGFQQRPAQRRRLAVAGKEAFRNAVARGALGATVAPKRSPTAQNPSMTAQAPRSSHSALRWVAGRTVASTGPMWRRTKSAASIQIEGGSKTTAATAITNAMTSLAARLVLRRRQPTRSSSRSKPRHPCDSSMRQRAVGSRGSLGKPSCPKGPPMTLSSGEMVARPAPAEPTLLYL